MESKAIKLGGRDFTLLPVPAIGHKAIRENFAKIGSQSIEGIDALIDAVYYGVKRGILEDATFTRDFVAWNIDVTNGHELIQAVVELNRAARKEGKPGEA
jgi:hypothetical protein